MLDLRQKVSSPGPKPRGQACCICMWDLGQAGCWGRGGTPRKGKEVAFGGYVMYKDCVLCGSSNVGGLCCMGHVWGKVGLYVGLAICSNCCMWVVLCEGSCVVCERVVLCMGCITLGGLCCVEIVFAWELRNVEQLHHLWDCIVCV